MEKVDHWDDGPDRGASGIHMILLHLWRGYLPPEEEWTHRGQTGNGIGSPSHGIPLAEAKAEGIIYLGTVPPLPPPMQEEEREFQQLLKEADSEFLEQGLETPPQLQTPGDQGQELETPEPCPSGSGTEVQGLPV